MADSAFSDLRVWQHGMELAVEIYRRTASFPHDEVYSLTQQMRRAAVSIPSNMQREKAAGLNETFGSFLLTREDPCWNCKPKL